MEAGALIEHIYPSMFAIHDLSDQVALAQPQTGWIPMPPRMRPSYIFMEAHGVYLIGK
jgi:protein transport protein SEC24